MYSGLTNQFLYTAIQISCKFADEVPKSRELNPSGSGFLIRISDEIFIVTNRHVVDCVFKDPKYSNLGLTLREIYIKGYLPDASGLPTRPFKIPIIKCQILFPNNRNDDIVLLKSAEIPTGITFDYFVDESIIAKSSDFSTGLEVSDWLGIPSYQEWSSDQRPLLRMGTISSDPRFPYQHGNIRGRCVLYEGFSFGGSSGGPVFAFQRGVSSPALKSTNYRPLKLVGVNAGHLPVRDSGSNAQTGSHSGLSIFYSSEIILEMAAGQNVSENYKINPKNP